MNPDTRAFFADLRADLARQQRQEQRRQMGERQGAWAVFVIGVGVLVFMVICLLRSCEMRPAEAAETYHTKASYYTKASCQREDTGGVYTANGEVFDETAFTAALPTHHFGQFYRVCVDGSTSNRTLYHRRRCVVVRHNDYGPGSLARHRDVGLDLTPAAFAVLAPLSVGVIPVEITEVTP